MNTEQPLFTVATITYNSGRWVRQAIESILASSFTDFELLISDDCSSDDTWDIIQQYSDPRIKAWRNEENIGEYPNRNKVLAEARGRYLLFVDGDDILYKDSLQRISNYINFFPNPIMIWAIPQPSFIVFPYLVKPETLFLYEYFSLNKWSIIGFAETFFLVEQLKNIGGFSNRFVIGDVYVKRKLAMYGNTLLIGSGVCFWRTSLNQASQRARVNYSILRNTVAIDNAIFADPNFPLSDSQKKQAQQNLKITMVKLTIRNTLLKGRVRDFLTLFKEFEMSIVDFRLLFYKGKYDYDLSCSGENPLFNNYNFI